MKIMDLDTSCTKVFDVMGVILVVHEGWICDMTVIEEETHMIWF